MKSLFCELYVFNNQGLICVGFQNGGSVMKVSTNRAFHDSIHPSKPVFHLRFSYTGCVVF